MRPASRDGQDGAAQVYGLMVAGLIFVAVAGGLLLSSELAGEDSSLGEQAAREGDAESLANLLLGSPGQGWTDPDALFRLGLGAGPGVLNGSRVLLLNGTSLAAAPNGMVDYEEAHAAFGLAPSAGFNIRIVRLGLEEILQRHDFDYVRAIYMGDWGTISNIVLSPENATIAKANAAFNATMSTSALWERDVMEQVGLDFDNEIHLTMNDPPILVQESPGPGGQVPLLDYLNLTVWDGDVLYDNKQYLDDVLADKLTNGSYDLLVIGAGIQHNQLTSDEVKGGIEDFVRGGGTLMVFGSAGGNFNWMIPLFDVSSATVTGNITAPNPAHDILSMPWDLAWSQYDSQGLAWTIGTPSDFENILVQGGKPVVALSKVGTVGSGAVFLSTFKSNVIGAQLGVEEAQHLMFNSLLYRDPSGRPPIELLFGPEPPANEIVSSAVRLMNMDDPEFGLTPVRVEITAWGTG